MPRSAVATGYVDFVLPPAAIAGKLVDIARHPYMATPPSAAPPDDELILRILSLVQRATGVDFSSYKRNTIHRRISRRMVLHRFERLADYAAFVEAQPEEAQALHDEVLISVTSFFRDPEAYEALKRIVFPRLTEGRARHEPVRVWTLGCATGEEAYSTAMAFTEYVEDSGRPVSMQIFATDLSGHGIEKARTGLYAKGIEQDMSPERLRRFFTEVDGSYRIVKSIRDMCIFARQNALSDPPFSRMDLVACRNLLIYLDASLQKRLLPLLHYSLREGGYLWLGSSESISTMRDLFEPQDSRNKIYVRRAGVREIALPPVRLRRYPAGSDREHATEAPVPVDFLKDAERQLLERYAPPGVIVDSHLEITQFRGDTSPYLNLPAGRASLNLLRMLREGLFGAVRTALQAAQRQGKPAREPATVVGADRTVSRVDVQVLPLRGGEAAPGFAVLFETLPAAGATPASRPLRPRRPRRRCSRPPMSCGACSRSSRRAASTCRR